MNVMHIEDGSK